MTTNKSLPSSFVEADLDDIMEKLTTDEAISLISGHKAWWTAAVRLFYSPKAWLNELIWGHYPW